jgi:hypothetical protein
VVSIVVVLLAAVIAASAQKVRVGADPAVDLTVYKTYAWDKGTAGANPVVNQIIINAVDAQFAAKGIKKVETDPDLTLSAFVWTESDMQVSNPSWAPSLNSIATGVAVPSQSWVVTRGNARGEHVRHEDQERSVARDGERHDEARSDGR